jgi:hypothetical protein
MVQTTVVIFATSVDCSNFKLGAHRGIFRPKKRNIMAIISFWSELDNYHIIQGSWNLLLSALFDYYHKPVLFCITLLAILLYLSLCKPNSRRALRPLLNLHHSLAADMSTEAHSNTDVLVIGAGPAGLMAAVILTKMKLKVRIIDRRYVCHSSLQLLWNSRTFLRLPNEASGQADGIQPRMLEIWQSLGIGEVLRQQSEQVYRIVS